MAILTARIRNYQEHLQKHHKVSEGESVWSVFRLTSYVTCFCTMIKKWIRPLISSLSSSGFKCVWSTGYPVYAPTWYTNMRSTVMFGNFHVALHIKHLCCNWYTWGNRGCVTFTGIFVIKMLKFPPMWTCLNHIWKILILLWFVSLQDKANKRRMLMAIDTRKKMLKCLRLVRYDAFEKVCEQLGITYTFPPEYYRRVTRRWLAKKALCIKVEDKWPHHSS